MAEGVLVDNDVLLKVSAYRIGDWFLAATAAAAVPAGLLGVARFVVAKQIQRSKRLNDKATAAVAFAELVSRMTILEPTAQELATAADLEEAAQEGGLDLDTGESQLLALALCRNCGPILTGDKRAIRAIHMLGLEAAAGRLACFEQLICEIVQQHGARALCAKICAEAGADKVLAICCQCHSGTDADDGDVLECLASYVGDLRKGSGSLLISGNDLSALAA